MSVVGWLCWAPGVAEVWVSMDPAQNGANGAPGSSPAIGGSAQKRGHTGILEELFRAQPRASATRHDGSPIPHGISRPDYYERLPPSPPPKPPSLVEDRIFGAPPAAHVLPTARIAIPAVAPHGNGNGNGGMVLQTIGPPTERADTHYTVQAPRAGFRHNRDGALEEKPIAYPALGMERLTPGYTGAKVADARERLSALPVESRSKVRSGSQNERLDETDHVSDAPVLQGYNPNTWDPPLRYGDSISLLVDGLNAVTAYSGSEDGRPWIEVLKVFAKHVESKDGGIDVGARGTETVRKA